MFVVTFYSFRGGVGRTMALANAAFYLARAGRSVFLVDFDLEAPGLSLMDDFQPAEGQEPAVREGLFGFLRAGLDDQPLPDLRSLAYETRLSVRLKEKKERRKSGAIHILPTGGWLGMPGHYDLTALRLGQLYQTQTRSYVIDALRVKIEEGYKPDYVFVDSRTGLTEVGGICTVHLADLVVIVFGLNRQNVEGTAIVLGKLSAARSDFAKSVLFVASPVPTGEQDLKRSRLENARKVFAEAMKVEPGDFAEFAQIPYHPQLALSDGSFIADFPEEPLSLTYVSLARAIQERNPTDPDNLQRRFHEILRGEPATDWETRLRSLGAIADVPNAPAAVLNLYAILLDTSGSAVSPEPYFRRAVQEEPGNAHLLGNCALFLKKRGRFEEAEEYYRRAVEADPKHANSLGNYALFLAERRRFEEAEGYFRRALDADPKHANSLGNYAVFLHERERFEEAEQYYRRAIEVDPQDASSLGDYAWFVYERRRDLTAALDLTQRACALKPDDEVWHANHGLFLLLLGRREEARGQYERAIGLVKDEESLDGYCLKDLRDAAEREPGNRDIPEMIDWLRARWAELHKEPA